MITHFGKTIIIDETEKPYGRDLPPEVINKADNIIQIDSETGNMNFIKVKNIEGVTGVLGYHISGTSSDKERLNKINEIMKDYER